MKTLHHSALLNSALEQVLTQPTAPFRESWVKKACLGFCRENRLPVCEDDVGNLWVNGSPAKAKKDTSLLFVAHLDHPGILIDRFTQSRTRNGRILAQGKWLGGGPFDIDGCDVKIFSDVNALVVLDGIILKHSNGDRGPDRVWIEIKPSILAQATCTSEGLRNLGPWGACLWYRKQNVAAGIKKVVGRDKRHYWLTKAADDLVGACALLTAMVESRMPKNVSLLLTRAEESGFHGTLHVLQSKILNPEKTKMISVETSAELPGAEVGNGPVVRLGDRSTLFDPLFVQWIQEQATAWRASNKNFKFQRRVMDGGSCEATAFNCYGFKVAGLSTPLVNYHNISSLQGLLAGQNGKPLPEAVSADDVEYLKELLKFLMKNFNFEKTQSTKAFAGLKKKLLKNYQQHLKYF
jgi:putative aminopeptidase FrvX